MRLVSKPQHRRAISLTPLIDVVFLLLVFFMLASTFMKLSSVPITTTGSGTGTSPDIRNIALIHIAPNMQITVNGQTISQITLEAHLTRLNSDGITQAVIALRSGKPDQPSATVSDLTRTLAIARRIPFKSIRVVD